ncbi:MAG: hypothetical protein MUQ26_08940, partial [Armatimonadetes bacterium]|nr:hypothetical protein [Armatimonadota bacterium]
IAAVGGLLAAAIPSPMGKVAVVTVAATATLALSLLLVLSICRVEMRPRTELSAVVAMMIVFCLTRPVIFAILGKQLGHPAFGARLASLFSILPGQELLGNAALIAWAAFLGKLVSRVLREGKLFLPVAVVAAIADIITVYRGPVRHITENAVEVAQAFSASSPLLPPEGMAAPILAAVGIGDFLFLALFLAAALRHSMAAVKTMWAVFAVMLIAPAAFYIWPQSYGIPGLPFLAAAVIWANWRHLRFTPEEKRSLVFAGVLVAVAAAGLWAYLRT